MRNIFVYIFIALIAASCFLMEEEAVVEGVVVAKAGEKVLYQHDLERLFKKKVPAQDSIDFTKSYIDNWIKEQVFLTKAEMHLSEEQKDVQEKLQNYRNSLIIYRYQEQYIKDNLDTVITSEEIQKYYEENTPNFLLNQNLVKAIYVKVAIDKPWGELNKLVRWLNSTKEEDQKELYSYCTENAENFDDFQRDWVGFNMIQMQFPKKVKNPESTLKWKKFFQAKDTAYHYYVKIDEFVAKSEVAPLNYIVENIKTIIINKRKITLIESLEKDLMNDALNRDLIKIYQK